MGQWVGLGQMTNNCISLDLIEIIQFSPHPLVVVWVVGWVNGWDHVKSLKSNKS